MCLKPVQKVQIGKCFSSPSPPSPSSISDASHQNGYLWTKSQKCREASQNVIHERLIDLFLLGHGCSGSVWKAVPPFLLLVFVYECVYSDVHGSHLQIFIILFFIDFFLYWKYLIRSLKTLSKSLLLFKSFNYNASFLTLDEQKRICIWYLVHSSPRILFSSCFSQWTWWVGIIWAL